MHNHLIRAHLGKCSLKPSLHTQTTQIIANPPSCTSAQSVSSLDATHDSSETFTTNNRSNTRNQHQKQHAEPTPNATHDSSETFIINLRLRMSCARRAKLAALGYPVGSGPIFHPRVCRGVPGLTRTAVNPLASLCSGFPVNALAYVYAHVHAHVCIYVCVHV